MLTSADGAGNVVSNTSHSQRQHQKLQQSAASARNENGVTTHAPPMLHTDSRSNSDNASKTTADGSVPPASGSNGLVMASRGTSETSLLNAPNSDADTSDAISAQQRLFDRQTSAPVGGAAAVKRRAELLKQRSVGSQGSIQRSRSNRSDSSTRTGTTVHTAQSINYKGVNIYQAAAQGSLPLCVLLWGMASPKRVNLMTPDHAGNTPLHYAALAESAEVVGFLLQQSRGYFSETVRLVDVRNQDGETPLLRAMSTGVPVVIKALVEDAGSDILATDNMGGTAFMILAKCGHLWCLNYVYHVMCTKHGVHVAQEMLHSLDVEGHSALDWASDAGDINIIEYFIRRGLSPMRVDPFQRSALFWAVKAGHVGATRYLVLCGCNADEVDIKEQTPRAIAKSCNNIELMSALNVASRRGVSYCGDRSTAAESDHRQQSVARNDEEAPGSPVLYSLTSGNTKVSHAIFNQCKSRPWVALLYGLAVFITWILAVLVPFYAWLFVVAVTAVLFRRYEKRAQDAKRSNSDNTSRRPLSTSQKLLLAHEKGLGVWLGTVAVLALFLLGSLFESSRMYRHVTWDYHTERSGVGERVYNPTSVGGLSGAQYDPILFWITSGLLVIASVLWSRLVWFDRDPGIIDTRDNDFAEVMAQSLVTNGPPPNNLYCRTTLVKKPIRSKYCTRTGCVVARMDHYCIWLNITIGFGNHRTFILFLLVHLTLSALTLVLFVRALYREIESSDDTCGALDAVLGMRFFFPVIFSFFLLIIFLGLSALTTEQLRNMAKNMTTNERINMQRYSWMVDEEGRPCNKFDRGIFSNIMEFWGVPGYAVDYRRIFLEPDTPPPQFRDSLLPYMFRQLCCCIRSTSRSRGLGGIALSSFSRSSKRSTSGSEGSHSSLTQENVMRLSAAPSTQMKDATDSRGLSVNSRAEIGVHRENGQFLRSSEQADRYAPIAADGSPTKLSAQSHEDSRIAVPRSSRQRHDQQPFHQQVPQQELRQPHLAQRQDYLNAQQPGNQQDQHRQQQMQQQRVQQLQHYIAQHKQTSQQAQPSSASGIENAGDSRLP